MPTKDISGRIDPFPKEELLGLLSLIDRSLKEEDRLKSSWGGMENAGISGFQKVLGKGSYLLVVCSCCEKIPWLTVK